MIEVEVYLNEIDKVKSFVNQVAKYDSEVVELDLISGRYVINAKSILGIFSLDLSKNITLSIDTKDKNYAEKIVKDLTEYIV